LLQLAITKRNSLADSRATGLLGDVHNIFTVGLIIVNTRKARHT